MPHFSANAATSQRPTEAAAGTLCPTPDLRLRDTATAPAVRPQKAQFFTTRNEDVDLRDRADRGEGAGRPSH